MYTVEFTTKGWAVFINQGFEIKKVSKAFPGDVGREVAFALAANMNRPPSDPRQIDYTANSNIDTRYT